MCIRDRYENGSRTPKADVTAALAKVLDVSPKALDVPDIDSYTGLMHTLFTLEDRYGCLLYTSLAISALSVGRGAPLQSVLYCSIIGTALAVAFASFSANTCFVGTIISPDVYKRQW